MIACRFNPFSLPIAEFSPAELDRLREVDEGWYIDYKSEPVSVSNLGKCLSSFANQYGGWIFIGVKEGSNKSLRAGSFPGIAIGDVPPTMIQIREGVTKHVSPSVFFEHRIVEGPLAEIGLDPGRAIIVVYVPEGANPPYVHSSGKIYRRRADSSDPESETDRAVLDAMWLKSEGIQKQFRDFILEPADNLAIENPFCCIYLISDPTFLGPEHVLHFDDFAEAMNVSHGGERTIPALDNIFPTQDGFVARCLSINDPWRDLTGLRWWYNGNARITIPMNFLDNSVEYEHIGRHREFLVEMHRAFQEQHLNMVDFEEWVYVAFGLTMHYLDLRDRLKATGKVWGKAIFSKLRFHVPFLGVPSYLEKIRRFGFPVIPDRTILVPEGSRTADLVELKDDGNSDIAVRGASLIFPLIHGCLFSVGVVESRIPQTAGSELIQAISDGFQRTLQRFNTASQK